MKYRAAIFYTTRCRVTQDCRRLESTRADFNLIPRESRGIVKGTGCVASRTTGICIEKPVGIAVQRTRDNVDATSFLLFVSLDAWWKNTFSLQRNICIRTNDDTDDSKREFRVIRSACNNCVFDRLARATLWTLPEGSRSSLQSFRRWTCHEKRYLRC